MFIEFKNAIEVPNNFFNELSEDCFVEHQAETGVDNNTPFHCGLYPKSSHRYKMKKSFRIENEYVKIWIPEDDIVEIVTGYDLNDIDEEKEYFLGIGFPTIVHYVDIGEIKNEDK